MAFCNGYPDIAVVPPVGTCCGSALYAIGKLPTAYPPLLSNENLQTAYGYTVSDFNIESDKWNVYVYDVSGGGASQGTTGSTCSAVPTGSDNDGRYYSYYDTVLGIEAGRDWIVKYLNCNSPSSGITKGPAVLVLEDVNILPSPTVTPATPQTKLRVNNPWHNVLQVSSNNIIFAPRPTQDCNGSWRLIYTNESIPKITWRCEDEDTDEEPEEPIPPEEWEEKCEGLSLTVKILGDAQNITGSTITESKLNSFRQMSIQVTPCWKGEENFEGNNLEFWEIYTDKDDNVDYAPEVVVSGPPPDRFEKIYAMAPNTCPPSRWHEITFPISASARTNDPANDPRKDPAYAPCCEDIEGRTEEEIDALNRIGKTKVTVEVLAVPCNVRGKASFYVKFDKKDVDEDGNPIEKEIFEGNLSGSIGLETYDVEFNPCEGGYAPKIGPEDVAEVGVWFEFKVEGGDYCSCYDTASISVHASGGVDAKLKHGGLLEIPKGVHHDGETFNSTGDTIIIYGNGEDCTGTVTVSGFGDSRTIYVNRDCKCAGDDEENTARIGDVRIKGDKYIKVSKEEDEHGPYFQLKLGNVTECDKVGGDDDEYDETFGDWVEGNPTDWNDEENYIP